jgi:opine dehydrogenase
MDTKEYTMKVGIAGAGGVALGNAALLCRNGHTVGIWSPSGERTRRFADGASLTASGAIEGTFQPSAMTSAKDMVEQNDVIILALPAYGHRMVIDAIASHLQPQHVVIISSHLSFAALYISKLLAERNIQIPIVAWSTTVTTGKAPSQTEVRVGNVRAGVDMAVIPVKDSERGLSVCKELFGDRFLLKDDIITVALSNLNPQDHMGIALCNLTRIEKGEIWGQNANITPAVGRLLESLDLERLAVAESYGKTVRTIFDHFALSFDISGASVASMSHDLSARGSDSPGPAHIETRYVLEDVPYGLIPTLYLAELCGRTMPLHKAGIEIFGACYGRDFELENDILPLLGPLEFDRLKVVAQHGYWAVD